MKRGDFSSARCEKKFLVVVLDVCNVSQEMLSLLCGVGKTSIHHSMYDVCTEELDWAILRAIICWSGTGSFDETWLRIDGVWHFALCAVDSMTGFPWLMQLYPNLDEVSWTVFFQDFKRLSGIPQLITSDGSVSLAAARQTVFNGVRFQLCTFHTRKNLMKQIRRHVHDSTCRIRCLRLAKHIFSNTYVSSRKHAANT